jgi:hypothetical protein
MILMINFIMINGLISYLKNYKRRLNDNNYFGTEYDYELKLQENKKFQFINTEHEEMYINTEHEEMYINTEQEEMYINMRKYNLLKRAIFNIKYEQDLIVKELLALGVDISILDDDDE